MSQFGRSIKLAFDKKNNVLVDADVSFKITKEAFAKRKQFIEDRASFECLECGEELHISGSKYDRLHFRHSRSDVPCILKESSLTPLEIEQFNNLFRGKESERHKYLKHKISVLLSNTSGVDSIITDSKFIFDEGQKRKPDVYCRYQNKELVFEIQLSNLPLRYIVGRHNFYKKKNIYLIWILDDFDVSGQSYTERDIKYLTAYQNFFKLNESSDIIQLDCTYKLPFITSSNELRTIWKTEKISLNHLSFCEESFQVYYFNYPLVEIKRQDEIDESNKQIKFLENDRVLKLANNTALSIVRKIKTYRDNGISFYNFSEYLTTFSEQEISSLNRNLNFRKRKHNDTPVLNHYLRTAQSRDNSFIQFLLKERKIELDVNTVDEDGNSTLVNVYENRNLNNYNLIENLFVRGYILKESDLKKLKEILPISLVREEIVLVKFYSKVSPEQVEIISKHRKLFYIIESARCNEMIGFNYLNWVSFAVHAVDTYKKYWLHIETAFNKYGLSKIINSVDKKGTFKRKVDEMYDSYSDERYDSRIDDVVDLIFEDLHNW